MTRSFRRFLLTAVLTLTAAAAPLVAQAPDSVWVNLRSGVYHCPGTRDFGITCGGNT